MKSRLHDTLFFRLFLLLFIIFTLSNYIGVWLYVHLEHRALTADGQLQPGPESRYFWLMLRLIGSVLTAWIAAKWLSGPIRKMADAAKELGINLQRQPLDETRGPAEVRQAAIVFNQMQSQLKKQLEERNRFLAAISHDLRTPLTRIKLRSEKISSDVLKTDIRNDIDEMARMIDETLEFLREENHHEPWQMLDITSLVNSIAEDFSDQGYKIIVRGDALPICSQPLSLRRCLNNLIGNAIKYGNSAEIYLDDKVDKLVISIKDNGEGIPEDQLEAVFSPFYRLENSRNRHTGGVGLGLSIAREIAQKHQGSLYLENMSQGGLCVTLELPKFISELSK